VTTDLTNKLVRWQDEDYFVEENRADGYVLRPAVRRSDGGWSPPKRPTTRSGRFVEAVTVIAPHDEVRDLM
jgi:hypothetical protein